MMLATMQTGKGDCMIKSIVEKKLVYSRTLGQDVFLCLWAGQGEHPDYAGEL